MLRIREVNVVRRSAVAGAVLPYGIAAQFKNSEDTQSRRKVVKDSKAGFSGQDKER